MENYSFYILFKRCPSLKYITTTTLHLSHQYLMCMSKYGSLYTTSGLPCNGNETNSRKYNNKNLTDPYQGSGMKYPLHYRAKEKKTTDRIRPIKTKDKTIVTTTTTLLNKPGQYNGNTQRNKLNTYYSPLFRFLFDLQYYV